MTDNVWNRAERRASAPREIRLPLSPKTRARRAEQARQRQAEQKRAEEAARQRAAAQQAAARRRAEAQQRDDMARHRERLKAQWAAKPYIEEEKLRREQLARSGHVVALAAGRLACPSCGISVPTEGASGQRVTATDTRASEHVTRAEFQRCPTCQARHDLAQHVGRFPAMRARLGNRAGDTLAAALDALAAAHQPVPTEEWLTRTTHLSHTHAATLDLTRTLGRLGPGIQWQQAGLPDRAARHAWSHVTGEQRQDVLDARARLMRLQVAAQEPPHRLAPPQPSAACLMCGVGHVEVPAQKVVRVGGDDAARHQVWTSRSASPQTLGGRPGPNALRGHVCPDCDEAVTAAGAIGHSAMVRAFRLHLLAVGREQDAAGFRDPDEVSGVVGWAALPGRSPGREPWAHQRVKKG